MKKRHGRTWTEMLFGAKPQDVRRGKPERTPEREAAVSFLDALRSGTDEEMPVVPLAAVVAVEDYREIPLAKEQYALVTVRGADGATWKVAVFRGTVRPRAKALFVSGAAALPVEPRFRNEKVATYKERKFHLGNAITAVRLIPHVKRHVYRLNSGILYPLAKFREVKDEPVGTEVSTRLNIVNRETLQALNGAVPRYVTFTPKAEKGN